VFRNFTRGFLLTLNGIFIFLYLLSAAAPFISPAKAWPMGFIGLAFPFLLIVMLLWLIFWLLVRTKYALLPLAALILSGTSLYHYFSFNTEKNTATYTSRKISVMSYNVKVFDLYNWSKNKETSSKILETIFNADADIICIQEFYTDNSEHFNMLKKLGEVYPHSHVEITLTLRGTDKWGIATFSKFPIRRKETIKFENAQHNLAIASDVFIDGNPVKIYNTHLQSIHFNYDELASIETVADSIRWKPMDNIFNKLRYAFYWRSLQSDKLKQHMNESSAPIILCGDFNDTPNSYTYRRLLKGLQDSFDEAGRGIGQTYFGKMPTFRIDYILADKKFPITRHEIFRNPYSDHYAIMAEMYLP
jgi:endonuclease/exonuclease/phosphatase family metal-dependent hydrolase